MTNKIFRSIFLVAIAVFSAALILIMGILYEYFSLLQMRQLEEQTALAASVMDTQGLSSLDQIESDRLRITWVEANGTVKYDSKTNSEDMENHLEREEIREASQTGRGSSARYSTTLTERQFYAAERLSDGSILRLSVSQLTWWSLLLAMLPPIIFVVAAALGLSLYLAYRLSRAIVRPLNELDLDAPEPNDEYVELNPLIHRIQMQQRELKLQRAELDRTEQEFNAATQNMSEGIVLLNETGTILSINEAALRLLEITRYCIGKDLLLFQNTPALQELIHTAQSGEHAERTVRLGGESYQVNASPIISEGKLRGIAMIILDISEKEKAEKMRKEFTANVSHELKTPLHTISGCAELLAGDMVKAEDIPQFAQRIYAESERMITLINDIISLAGLDEGIENIPKERVDLYHLAKEAMERLAPAAREAEISLSLTGSSAYLYGIPPLLSEIISNLLENAVKYNVSGGSVEVDVADSEDSVILSVRDTGIGIPADQQERIFERFYRVDKSRSKEVGGTGLGLSIVKHAAKLHQAEVEVKSAPEQGTTIRIVFPKGSASASV